MRTRNGVPPTICYFATPTEEIIMKWILLITMLIGNTKTMEMYEEVTFTKDQCEAAGKPLVESMEVVLTLKMKTMGLLPAGKIVSWECVAQRK